MSELPKGWIKTKLSVVGNTVTGNTPPRKNPEFYGGNVPFVKPGDIDIDKELIHSDETLSELGCDKARVLKKGSVLVTCIGNIGRVGLAMKPMATNQQINAIEFNDLILPKYGFHYCRTLSTWLNFNASATTVAIINKSKFSEAPFILAPLAEQKRIVEKLDEVLAQVDTIKARLDGVPALLKRFRQSVLAAAVSGKLTEEWRGGAIPKWEATVFSDICNEITVGFVGKMKDKYTDSGVLFLRSQNVRAFKYDPKNVLFISEEFHNEIHKSHLNAGDLAIVRSGAPGTTCVIPESLGKVNCSDLVIARPSERLNPKFGCIFMNSEVAQKNVASNQVGIAQQHFNVGSMKKMPIELPDLAEQQEIVRLVDQYFAFADTIEAQVKKAQARVDNLTQSILAKAFRGELVPQDPNDEPADKLLERIAQARNEAEALAKAAKKVEAAKKRAVKSA
ncbi:restriction endonuclease subunit S [Vibrio campbellii]|uniref:restriction endonuclease subunit S n=1 Tax=Vibrio campbellii TaxID=680 RepID=UPI003D9C9BB9